MGFKPVYLGDEAVVVPEVLARGRPIRKVRRVASRAWRRPGTGRDVLEVRDVDPALAGVARRLGGWRGRWPERGFTMAMDRLFAYPEALVAVAERADGHVGGFIHVVPVPATGGLSLASMRRREEVPTA
jgi:lysylphosphatidylglycerol synthetase-like protein (DUF2156 family)